MLFRFAQPEFLWLLALIPLAAMLAGRFGKTAALRFSAVEIAGEVARPTRSRPGRFSRWLKIAALVAGVIALARPQAGRENRSQHSEGIDILMTVDLSTSMWAHDFAVDGAQTDRLTAVKGVMRTFVEARPNDRIGLVAFAGFPYLASPLTLNHAWVLERLDGLGIGMIEDGTAIGSAIGSAANRLADQEGKGRVLILLTDGANNSGQIQPLQAAEAAAALGIRIYTVGVGREGAVPFPRFDRSGRPIRDASGRMIFTRMPSDLDLETLAAVAARTGGRFFHARNLRELENVYAEIDALETTDVTIETTTLYRDWFVLPLALSLACYLLDWILRQTRFRRLP